MSLGTTPIVSLQLWSSNTFYQNHHNVGTSSPLFAVKSFCYQAAELMSTKRQSLDFQLGRKQFFLPLFLCLSFLCRKTPVHSFRCRAGIGGKAQGGQGGGGGGVLVSLSQHLTDLLNSLSWDTSMKFPLWCDGQEKVPQINGEGPGEAGGTGGGYGGGGGLGQDGHPGVVVLEFNWPAL